jgi:hypothetical protein
MYNKWFCEYCIGHFHCNWNCWYLYDANSWGHVFNIGHETFRVTKRMFVLNTLPFSFFPNTCNHPKILWTIKAKAVPLHAMKALGGRGVYLLLILDLGTRYGWLVSVTPRPLFSLGERTTGTHCTGGWVGPRAGLDTEARGKIFCPRRGSNLDRPVVQPVARRYTDWATRLIMLWTMLNQKNGNNRLKSKQLDSWYALLLLNTTKEQSTSLPTYINALKFRCETGSE